MAAPSKPTNVSIANTMPRKIPFQPFPSVADGVNTAAVLPCAPPATRMPMTTMRMIRLSAPTTVRSVRIDVRMPRVDSSQIAIANSTAQTDQLTFQPSSSRSVDDVKYAAASRFCG